MNELQIENPMLVARDGETVLLMSRGDLGKPNAPAQTWSPDNGYGRVQPLQVWFKFLELTDVNPPEPWTM